MGCKNIPDWLQTGQSAAAQTWVMLLCMVSWLSGRCYDADTHCHVDTHCPLHRYVYASVHCVRTLLWCRWMQIPVVFQFAANICICCCDLCLILHPLDIISEQSITCQSIHFTDFQFSSWAVIFSLAPAVEFYFKGQATCFNLIFLTPPSRSWHIF
jgi:hypothetical protein